MRGRISLTPELVARVERKIPQEPDPVKVPMTDEDYAGEAAAIRASQRSKRLLVYGYGSLLWNPGISYRGRQTAWLRGWHRSFCMRLVRFRGSDEQPGLMLALEQGGSCRGEVFEIDPQSGPQVVDALLRREVPYVRTVRPWRWVKAEVEGRSEPALTFYAGMRGDRYHERLNIEEQARRLARAAGHGGSGAAYLHQTVMKLEELGIHDSYLWRLQALVASEIASSSQ